MLRPALYRTVFAAAALFLLAPAAPLRAQHAKHREHKRFEREQIEDLEQDWREAALTNDIPAMDKLLSDDYLGITSTGEVVTKAQQLDHMRNRRFLITKLQSGDVKIKLIGNIAIVTSLAQVEGSSDGVELHGAYRYTRVYQRVASGAWKITSFEVTPATRLHPVNETEPAPAAK
jgi:ketosteroid isomerase-like protein